MAKAKLAPHMVMADENGNVYDDPHLLMLCRRGGEWALPRPDELVPLPRESELFLLPGRRAVGFDPAGGVVERVEQTAVAAFAAPGHTLSAHPAYSTSADAAILPLFAYGAVGFAQDRLYICAHRVDTDTRQQFAHIPKSRIEGEARRLLRQYPHNRLIRHIISNCVLRYACPAARNFVLGRYEAPLPTQRACNARCLGCISAREADSPVPATPQCRLFFRPDPEEIVEIMRLHQQRETGQPIYSFGQGCEGDPLMDAELLAQSIEMFRAAGGKGTINCNTNAGLTRAVIRLAEAGLTSLRVSLNSVREDIYRLYYRPQQYTLDDVRASVREARIRGLFVSLNLLFFPGVTDTEDELAALSSFVQENGVSMIQWRNLNIDPEWYFSMTHALGNPSPCMGLAAFMKRLKKSCPWLRYGYFNPWLGERAEIAAPMPDTGAGGWPR
ncbi:MAG: radical SAM protein [Desulfovibrio sp.]|jgi:pyruvate-formate lyase-activating enzyme|nr:radical SAM protein [Desulfovibrio sp.]